MPFRTESTGGSRLRDDGFSTFLRELHAQRESNPDDVESKVVGALTDGGKKDVAELLAYVGGPALSDLLAALDSLQRFGLVERSGEPGQETFRLSPLGHRTSAVIGVATGSRR